MLEALTKMMNDIDELKSPMRSIVHPCAKDTERLECSSMSCLREAYDSLGPDCADFIKNGKLETYLRPPSKEPIFQGSISMMSSGPDGVMRVMSRPLETNEMPSQSQMLPPLMMPEMPPLDVLMSIPLQLSQVLQDVEISPRLIIEDVPEPAAPCMREIDLCKRETGAASKDAIEGCLLAHLEQLSPPCRCFVHHITDGRAEMEMQRSRPSPQMKIASMSAPSHLHHPLPPSHHPTGPFHQLGCFFFLFTVALLVSLVLRSCCILCFRKPVRRVALVPPRVATSVRGVDATPMMVSELKLVESKPVRV